MERRGQEGKRRGSVNVKMLQKIGMYYGEDTYMTKARHHLEGNV